jgi:hypothetical protein
MSLEQFFKEASFEEGLLLVSFYDREKHANDGWAGAWDQLKGTWKGLDPEMQKGLQTVGIGTALGTGAGLLSAGASDKKRRNWLDKGLTGAALGAMGGAGWHLAQKGFEGVTNPGEGTQPTPVESRVGERVGEKLESTGKPIGWSGGPVPSLYTMGPRLASDPMGEGLRMGAGAGTGFLGSWLLRDKMPGAALRGQQGANFLLNQKLDPKKPGPVGLETLHRNTHDLAKTLPKGTSATRQAELIGRYGSNARQGYNVERIQQNAGALQANLTRIQSATAAARHAYSSALTAALRIPAGDPRFAAAQKHVADTKAAYDSLARRLGAVRANRARHTATLTAAGVGNPTWWQRRTGQLPSVTPANRTWGQWLTHQPVKPGQAVTQSALQQVGRPKGIGHGMKRHWLGTALGLAAELLLSNNLRQAPANMYQEQFGRPYGD